MRTAPRLLFSLTVISLALLSACGGGGGSGSSSGSGLSSGGGTQSQAFTITTASILPGVLQGHAYSTTLTAVGGRGPLHWSIAQASPTALFVNGLTIDPSTGVLSGTANFLGTAGFLATVTDSSSPAQTVTKGFYITANTPLSVPATQAVSLVQYSDVLFFPAVTVNFSGGIPPFTITIPPGCLPPGLKPNAGNVNATPNLVIFLGAPIATGTYQCRVTVQDSLTPPEDGTEVLTITVAPATLALAPSLPSNLLLGRPFSGRLIARGGTPPYSFAGGAPVPGLTAIDASSGQTSGTPTAAGTYYFTATVTDSGSPRQSAQVAEQITVAQPLGRNDSPATATPIGNGGISASISPYIDPTNGTPAPGDNDFYKLVSLGGATVHISTVAKLNFPDNPLDTVLKIVDGNGHQLSTCNQPGAASTNFTSACLNDDVSATLQDSALDFQVPGATNSTTTFYAHVLDWRGDARPDMMYSLIVSGVISPITINTANVMPAARGKSYSSTLTSTNGMGTVTWAIASGSPPPGITLSSNGSFGGSATTDGTYTFTVRATDSANPPQTTTAPVSIQVVDPVTITSPATWPDACVNQFYSFAIQTAGGLPPVNFGFMSNAWIAFNMTYLPAENRYDGIFKGTSSVTGTFTGSLSAFDATGKGAVQTVTVTVKTCP